ncbi:MAG: serine/threonine protein kinase [Cyanobacteria bacterium HKST-UBA02]|nr:serine/threonine protein kinase [Cyanobacteria bacterium HKST-UBA02]
MTDDPICPICLNPKKSKSDGSLTQWIMACTCDVAPDPEIEQTAIELCQTCGKKIGKGRQGSFTQFIFRSDLCSCDLPRPIKHGADSLPAAPGTETHSGMAVQEGSDLAPPPEELEEEILLDERSFPVERYRAVGVLGQGAGSKVYLARDRLLNKLVAVKTLTAASPQMLISFQDEARATSRLRHRSIADVIDFGATTAGTPYMVLDYVEGNSLQAIIASDGTLPWNLCRSIFIELCEALSYAHEQGIFHRDIKPSNILINLMEDGTLTVHIIDWGIAISMGAKSVQETDQARDTIVGTPFYMSPDQGLGRPYDSRSEIYSLGCVLFECLAGTPPFSGETALETLSKHASEEPPRLSEIIDTPRIPNEIEAVIGRALEKEPDSRYQSMQEFAAALEKIPENSDEQSRQIKPAPELSFVKRGSPVRRALARISITLLSLAAIAGAGYFAYITIQPRKYAEPMPINLKYPASRYEDVRNLQSYLDKDANNQDKWQEKDNQLFTRSDVTDEELKRWKDTDIVDLTIRITDSFTGDGLKYIKPDSVTRLEILSRNFNDEGAKNLLRFRNLSELRIAQSKALSIEAFEEIVKLPGLKRLHLMTMTLPSGAIDLIARKTAVEWLVIDGCEPITVHDMEEIATMPKLGILILTNLKIDDTCVPALLKAKFSDLDINHTKISGQGLLKLAENKNFHHLTVSLGDGITREDFHRFEKLRPDCTIKARGFMGLPADADADSLF